MLFTDFLPKQRQCLCCHRLSFKKGRKCEQFVCFIVCLSKKIAEMLSLKCFECGTTFGEII